MGSNGKPFSNYQIFKFPNYHLMFNTRLKPVVPAIWL